MPAPLGVHHVALTVTDVDRSAAWYADVLGFVESFREEGDGRRAVVMTLPGARHGVGLVEFAGNDHEFDPTRTGLDHYSFAVASREELDEWAARFDEKGVTRSGPFDVPPGAILNFKDPDGIALAIFWDRT